MTSVLLTIVFGILALIWLIKSKNISTHIANLAIVLIGGIVGSLSSYVLEHLIWG